MHPHSDNSKTDFISESLKQEGGWGGVGGKMSPAQKLKVDMTKTDGRILFIFIFGFR